MNGGIIRKRLSEREGAPPDTRYSPECDCVETSTDGGATWNENPGADPRVNPAYLVPPNTSPDAKCAAAAGMVKYVRDSVDAGINASTVVGVGNSVLAILLVALPVSWMVALVLAIAEAIVTIGSAALIAAFTEDVYEDMLCTLYGLLDAEGRIDQSGLDDFQAWADTVPAAAVGAVVYSCILGAGVVGFNNFGSIDADPEAECTVCGCGTAFQPTWDIPFEYPIADGFIIGGSRIYCQLDGTPLVITLDHPVLVSRWQMHNGGSLPGYTITMNVGTATISEDYQDNFGVHTLLVDPPQLVSELTLTQTPGAANLSFLNCYIDYCEP